MIMNNSCVRNLPKHLLKYIVNQNYAEYTSIDHAVWRYILRQSYKFHSIHAHHSYLEGLKKTGINIESIPNILEMNEILAKIGWGAVCVDGFIPPSAFMEFQAYKVLVIAADIRFINHIEYTPAPDIVHEAAGHAPIIANAEYAEYLRLFGEIGCKAISSKRDNDLYEAIRFLSILKENPNSSLQEVEEANSKVIEIQKDMGEMSEMAKIRNLHWWTVEYGLIGEIGNPKIYGAGLLSSLSESKNCLNKSVKKIPYSIKAADFAFDITSQQPQLFITPDFNYLTVVLNEFANSMALRKGGTDGLIKAIESESLATVELTSGIQISGIFTDFIKDADGEVAWFKTSGRSILCEREQLLIGHGIDKHGDGFSTPVGKLFGFEKSLENYSIEELDAKGLIIGKYCELKFKGGIVLNGKLSLIRLNKFGKILLLSFEDCNVNLNKKILFKPEWGNFDLAVGDRICSVFAGSADKVELNVELYVSPTLTNRISSVDYPLQTLYQSVRDFREGRSTNFSIGKVFNQLKINYPQDWLLSLELLELNIENSLFKTEILDGLINKIKHKVVDYQLIINGLKLINLYD